MSTRELLAAYADILNRFGPDSDEAASFLDAHQDAEFAELAAVARTLKAALMR